MLVFYTEYPFRAPSGCYIIKFSYVHSQEKSDVISLMSITRILKATINYRRVHTNKLTIYPIDKYEKVCLFLQLQLNMDTVELIHSALLPFLSVILVN